MNDEVMKVEFTCLLGRHALVISGHTMDSFETLHTGEMGDSGEIKERGVQELATTYWSL